MIFGYTGAGKSNLVSTFISKALKDSNQPKNVIIFDINDGYTGLLADVLVRDDLDSLIVALDEDSLSYFLLD